MRVTAFLRERGVICYTAPVFDLASTRYELAEQLLSSDLDWYWESQRREMAAPGFERLGLPSARPLTLLTPATEQSLAHDYEERDVDGYGRTISLFGFDMGTYTTMPEPEDLLRYLADFAGREEGPIRLVIMQECDVPNDYFFFPHTPTESVERLLDTWGLTREMVDHTYAYDNILESMYGLPGPPAT